MTKPTASRRRLGGRRESAGRAEDSRGHEVERVIQLDLSCVAERAVELLGEAGVAVDYRSFDRMGHSMHGQDPRRFTDTIVDWSSKIAA